MNKLIDRVALERENKKLKAALSLIARQRLEQIRPAENWGEVAFGVLEYCVNLAKKALNEPTLD